MKPYLAVIKDSFREALVSRVLWVLLVFITLLLLALAPFGWDWQLSTTIPFGDIRSLEKFASDGKESNAGSPAHLVWNELSDSLRDDLDEIDETEPKSFETRMKLAKELNDLVKRDDLYSPDTWSEEILDDEGKKLAARQSKLNDVETARLNRLAIEAAFPGRIRSRSEKSIQFKYAYGKLFDPVPVTDEMFEVWVQVGLSAFMKGVVGILGIFVAVLVTASVIPNMFDPGSINLLLSKPISRSMLFLAKFAGGCSFVLINATYLLVGLWLLLGVRVGIWQHSLLYCIPIFLFVFVIYYCISALSGLVWRNAIISIVCTILFWAFCWGIGLIRGLADQLMIEPGRLANLVATDDDLLVVKGGGQLTRWNSGQRSWSPLPGKEADNPFAIELPPIAAPVFDPTNERIVVAVRGWPEKLVVAKESTGWRRQEIADCPAGTISLYIESDGSVLVVSGKGLHRLNEEPVKELPKLNAFGVKIPLGSVLGNERFQDAAPSDFDLPPNSAIDFVPDTGELLIWTDDTLRRLQISDDGLYEQIAETELGKDSVVAADVQTESKGDDKAEQKPNSTVAMMRVGGNCIVGVRNNGTIEVRDRESLKLKREMVPHGDNPPHSIDVSPDGRWFCVVFHHRRAVLYDAVDDKLIKKRGPFSNKDISAAGFTRAGNLVVADHVDRVREFSMPDLNLVETMQPKLSMMRNVYGWFIKPIHSVFPQPAELDHTRDYLLLKKQSVVIDESNPNMGKVMLDPWTPVWKCSIFVAVMLFVCCLYVNRKEF